jgi:hypothetical protein
MGKQFDQLQDDHIRFIGEQHMFFTGSAAPTGKVNISPKGMDSLRVMSPTRILWRNLTGSGNETDGHIRLANRITLMWCSFTTRPLILRAYGTATMTTADDDTWDTLNANFPPALGARQIFDVAVDMVQSSCGYAVPFFDHAGDREVLTKWADDKGPDGVRQYWTDRNDATLDGFPTEFTT